MLLCCFAAPCALLIARRTRTIVLLVSGTCLVGVGLERLLLVFPPHAWREADIVVAILVTSGFGGAFALSTGIGMQMVGEKL